MTVARSLWLTDRYRPALLPAALGALAEGQVRVESRFGAISRGTERIVASGEVPVSQYQRMRAPFQDGDFPFPVKYGYAAVGEVTEGPADRLGETVFCLHPHQDVFQVPADMAIAVPKGVPASRAVLAANMETALNAVWDAGIMAGDRVAVVGGGLLGLLVAFLAAKVPGASVTVIDVDGGRRPVAEAFGCAFADPQAAVAGAGGSDVVIHASATGEGLATAIALAGFEARIVEMSWFGAGEVAVPLGGAFHSQRLQIIGSQVGHVPAARRARWPLSRRMRTALELLDDEKLDLLISGETAFEALASCYCAILADPETLCHRIRYR